MILAAGEGIRLRPITLRTPKPLLEIGGETLIERHIEALVRAGIDGIVVNLHHMGAQIRAFVGDGSRWSVTVEYSEESELLETGGGIAKALPLLGSEPFVVVSADICTEFDFARLTRALPDGILGHLVMVNNPSHHPEGDYGFGTGESGGLRHLDVGATRKFNYGGMALLSAELFSGVPVARLPLRPLFDRAIAEGRMTGERYPGPWINIGTEAHLASARATFAAR